MKFDDVASSTLSALIDEYVHNANYRDILKDRLINALTFAELEQKYQYSERHLKRIVYRASEQLFSKIP